MQACKGERPKENRIIEQYGNGRISAGRFLLQRPSLLEARLRRKVMVIVVGSGDAECRGPSSFLQER